MQNIAKYAALTCLAATISIALGQSSICFEYGANGYDQPPGLQPGSGCTAYVECPTGYRCLTGRADKKVSNPFTSLKSCQYYSAGSGSAPNCHSGVPTAVPGGGGQAQVNVTDQTCSGGCLSEPGPPE